MSERQRLPLLAVIIVAAFSTHDPSAQTGEVMTPAAFATALYAMPQGVVESACAAKCQQGYDRAMNIAADKVPRRGYYAGLMSQDCPAPWQAKTTTNACVAAYFACDGKCGTYDDRCKAPCLSALQTCCNANDTANIAHERDVCLQTCSAAPAPAAGAVPPPPPPGSDQSKGATIDRRSEWTSLLKIANAMLDTVGLDKLDADQFDDMRRTLAFLQVRASMALHGSKYTVVSGGAGRLWLLTADGKQVLLHPAQSDMMRGGVWYGTEYQNTLTALTTLAGLSPAEAFDCIRQVRLANQGKGFGAGETLEFLPWQGFPTDARASSEFASIRGTINGGGDFI